jgi:membrane glycosyltransferase
MDALSRRIREVRSGIEALPPEAPLAMPEQSLWARRGSVASPRTGPRRVPARRLFVFAASIAMTMVAGYEMYEVLEVGGLTVLETAVLLLFVALFAWIALSFVSGTIGFVLGLFGRGRALGIDPAAPLPALAQRTALLLPTYNEDPHRVTARLPAIYE